MRLTEEASALLAMLCDPDGEAIDASIWADEIVLLFDNGFAQLEGTLQNASLVPTEAGRKRAAADDLRRCANDDTVLPGGATVHQVLADALRRGLAPGELPNRLLGPGKGE